MSCRPGDCSAGRGCWRGWLSSRHDSTCHSMDLQPAVFHILQAHGDGVCKWWCCLLLLLLLLLLIQGACIFMPWVFSTSHWLRQAWATNVPRCFACWFHSRPAAVLICHDVVHHCFWEFHRLRVVLCVCCCVAGCLKICFWQFWGQQGSSGCGTASQVGINYVVGTAAQ